MLENTNLIGMMLDREGRLIFANDTLLELVGWQREETLGQVWFDTFLPPEEKATTGDYLAQRIRTGESPRYYENPIITRSGERRLVAWNNFTHLNQSGVPESITSLGVDITDQKRYEQALQESEEHFRLLYEQAPVPYQSLDKNGCILNVNRAWLEALGYGREQVIGRWFGDFLAPEYRRLFPQRLINFQQLGEMKDVSFEMLRQDGSRVNVLFDGRIGHNAQGTFQQTHCVWRDVTAIQQAQRALQASEALLSRAEEVAGMGSFDWDLRTDQLTWSRNMYLIYGLDPEKPVDNLNEAWQEIIHPGDKARVRAEFSRMVENGMTWPMEFRMLRPDDGGMRLIRTYSQFIFDPQGAPVQCVGVHFDLTQQRQAEQALQESERTLATLMSNLPGMAYRCKNDADWTMTFVSQGCRMLTGYSREELVDSRGISYNEIIHPDDRAMVARQVQTALQARQPFMLAYRIQTAAGELKWVWERGSGVYAAAGELLFLEGLILDISERRKAEIATQEYAERLEILFELGQDFLKGETAEQIARFALVRIYRLGISQRLLVLQIETDGEHFRILKIIPDDPGAALKEGDLLPEEYCRPPTRCIQERSADYYDLTPLDATLNAHLKSYGVRRVFMAPLHTPAGPLGVLGIGLSAGQTLTDEQHGLVLQMANMLALALNQAQLTQRVQTYAQEMYQYAAQRRRDLETMYRVAAVVNEERELGGALRAALEWVLPAMNCEVGLIHLTDVEKDVLVLAAELGVEPEHLPLLRVFSGNLPVFREALQAGEPVSGTASSREMVGDLEFGYEEPFRYAVMPFWAQGEQAGVLSLVRLDHTQRFSPEELELLASFSNQLGIILTSTRLRARAELAAADEERQRLARELHDAVSQTLFSASVIAEALPRLWLRKPDLVRESLDELQRLTRGSLAEMRTLLVELRPGAFEQSVLEELLEQLADGLRGRTRLTVYADLGSHNQSTADLPAPVRLVFYRIAQEGLNNIVKHARAGSIWLNYTCQSGKAELVLRDDGRGFTPEAVAGGRFGLKIMQERAEEIGARLQLDSRPGEGTRLRLVWEAE